MGNTIATPSNNSNHEQPHPHHLNNSRRPSGKPASTKSLRKMTSSSTLSSLNKMYRQTNRSETSLSSKMSTRSSSNNNNKFGEKILDISKPTKFEHGIHVEFDRDSGKYMVREGGKTLMR
jgi:hypothetical protein